MRNLQYFNNIVWADEFDIQEESILLRKTKFTTEDT